MAKNDKKEQRRQWPSGVLTEEVIKKDVQTRLLPGAIGFTVAAVLFGVGLVPAMTTTSQVTAQIAVAIIGLAYCGWMAYRSWSVVLSRYTFEIRQDTVVGKRIVADTDKKDARQSDLTTRTPFWSWRSTATIRSMRSRSTITIFPCSWSTISRREKACTWSLTKKPKSFCGYIAVSIGHCRRRKNFQKVIP